MPVSSYLPESSPRQQAWAGMVGSTSGTDKGTAAGQWYRTEMSVLPCTATGIWFLVGTVGSVDNVIGAVDTGDGTLIANSATAGTPVAAAATIQYLPFVGGPRRLSGLIVPKLQFDSTSAKFRAISFGAMFTGQASGTFGTVPATSTPLATFTSSIGPVCGIF